MWPDLSYFLTLFTVLCYRQVLWNSYSFLHKVDQCLLSVNESPSLSPNLKWLVPRKLQLLSLFNSRCCSVEGLDSYMSPKINTELTAPSSHLTERSFPGRMWRTQELMLSQPDPVTFPHRCSGQAVEAASKVTRTWSFTSLPPVNTAS